MRDGEKEVENLQDKKNPSPRMGELGLRELLVRLITLTIFRIRREVERLGFICKK